MINNQLAQENSGVYIRICIDTFSSWWYTYRVINLNNKIANGENYEHYYCKRL